MRNKGTKPIAIQRDERLVRLNAANGVTVTYKVPIRSTEQDLTLAAQNWLASRHANVDQASLRLTFEPPFQSESEGESE